MSATRNRWRVASSSWANDYHIEGESVGAAIERALPRIALDAIPQAAGRLQAANASWQSGILGGHGGIVLELTALREGVSTTHYAMIAAAPDELPAPRTFDVPA